MSIIKENMKDRGVTRYELSLEGVKELIAKDLMVDVKDVTVDHKVVRVGESYMYDGYDRFNGLIITGKNNGA